MIKIVAAIAVLVLSTGCYTAYQSADNEPAAKSFIGSRCEATSTVLLPRMQSHLFNVRFAPACEKPPTIEIEKGTILRIVHFERVMDSFWLVVSVFAEAENGPAKGTRVVIGELFDNWEPPVIMFRDEVENLQPEAGRSLRAVDTAQRTRMFSDLDRGKASSLSPIDRSRANGRPVSSSVFSESSF